MHPNFYYAAFFREGIYTIAETIVFWHWLEKP